MHCDPYSTHDVSPVFRHLECALLHVAGLFDDAKLQSGCVGVGLRYLTYSVFNDILFLGVGGPFDFTIEG